MMMYTRDDVAIIQGKIPSHRSGSKRYSTTGIQSKDSYQYDTKTCMVSIPPTWHKRDLNAKHMHDDNKSIPTTYNKGSQNIT